MVEEKTRKKSRSIGHEVITRILFYSMFNWSMPVVVPAYYSVYPPSRRVEQQIIEKYKSLPKDFTVINYLNLSNMLVHHEGIGKGICRDYAIETFKTYKKLVENNNREDLEAKIKVTGANYNGYFINDGHMFVKFKDKGKWLNYESTSSIQSLSVEEIKMFSDSILEYKKELPSTDEPLVETLETFEGKRIFHPTVAAFKNGGLVGESYHQLKKWGVVGAVQDKLEEWRVIEAVRGKLKDWKIKEVYDKLISGKKW